jgi:hypothetical protein
MQLSRSICIKLLKIGRVIFARANSQKKYSIRPAQSTHIFYILHMNKCLSPRIYFPLKRRKETQYNNIYICTPLHSPRTISIRHWVCHYAAMALYMNTCEKHTPTHMREKKRESKVRDCWVPFLGVHVRYPHRARATAIRHLGRPLVRQLFWQSNASYTFPPVNILDHINRHLKLDKKNWSELYLWDDYSAPCAKMSRLFLNRQSPSKFL